MVEVNCPHFKYKSYEEAPNVEAFLEEGCDGTITIDENSINKRPVTTCPNCGREVRVVKINGDINTYIMKTNTKTNAPLYHSH